MKVVFTFWKKSVFLVLLLSLIASTSAVSQAIPRQWNETMISCIRKDSPRPTVVARRLYLASMTMYESWAVYDDDASPYLLGHTVGNFTSPFNGIPIPADVTAAQEKCMSYAMYRFLKTHYSAVPPANQAAVNGYIEGRMSSLGYDPTITSTDYSDGDPAKLGNYIAAQIQAYALQDGSNQGANYANQFYLPINGQLQPQLPGNPDMHDPNRWQSLCLSLICEQGTDIPGVPCVPVPCNAPALTPEWGNVTPFAMTDADVTVYNRDGHDWKVYMAPVAPPLLDTNVQTGFEDSFFKWGFSVNSIWHSFHTLDDGVTKDISPASLGNVDYNQLPTTFEEYKAFYDEFNGGTIEQGYDVNPVTGLPYEPQIVKRGDYTRVLSEFWADGPASETPPGHWFTIINHVADHPLFEMRWEGEGPILSELEWYARSYFALGAGLHDAAIACWSAKGYYDYARPIMALRFMADHGQSSDSNLPNYHPAGLPLIPGYIEMIETGDALAGENDENVGKVKLYTWLGPELATQEIGVGWKLAEEWWTYQKSTFVTPPFPAYYSGHSTYSRTAAEILTNLTGNEYFPGGMSEFVANPGFLAADNGPSEAIVLQWARYRDAADQCSLSRIYGGLHPPQDDIPGRKVGMVLGPLVYEHAMDYIGASIPRVTSYTFSDETINDSNVGGTINLTITFDEPMNTSVNPDFTMTADNASSTLSAGTGTWLVDGITFVQPFTVADANETLNNVIFRVTNAQDVDGHINLPSLSHSISIDTENPSVYSIVNDNSIAIVNDAAVAAGTPFNLSVTFSEEMNTASTPAFTFTSDASASLMLDAANSGWAPNGLTYVASFMVEDANEDLGYIDITTASAMDINGNSQIVYDMDDELYVDTKNPAISSATLNTNSINDDYVGTNFEIEFTFDENMNTTINPVISFPSGDPTNSILFDGVNSGWNGNTYTASYYTIDVNEMINVGNYAVISAKDLFGNTQVSYASLQGFIVDTENPEVTSITTNNVLLADANAGSMLLVTVAFTEAMNTSVTPVITFGNGNPLANSLTLNAGNSGWSGNTYVAAFDVADANEEIWNIDISSVDAEDANGNTQGNDYSADAVFSIDTKNPQLLVVSSNTYNITGNFTTFNIITVFDEAMASSTAPDIAFPVEIPTPLALNSLSSDWISETTYVTSYDVSGSLVSQPNIDIAISSDATDEAGNPGLDVSMPDYFSINIVINVDELDATHGAVLYPNPMTSGKTLFMEWQTVPTGLSINMYDASGTLVLSKNQISASEKRIALETSKLAAGMYMIHVNSDAGRAVYSVSIVK